MKKNILLLLAITLSFPAFSQQYVIDNPYVSTGKEINNWSMLSMERDSILGIGLDRAYQELIAEDSGKEIIVALIDSGVNINHPDLQGSIWVNQDEIPNNYIDDDKNGYIDDIYGWNYLGMPNGDVIIDHVHPHITILQEHNDWKDGIDGASKKDSSLLRIAQRAKIEIDSSIRKKIENGKKYHETFVRGIEEFPNVISNLQQNKTEELDGLEPTTDEGKGAITLYQRIYGSGYKAMDFIRSQPLVSYMEHFHNNTENRVWSVVDSEPYKIIDTGYGHPYVDARPDRLSHGTQTATVIAARRNNGVGLKGISNNIKIMPLTIISYPGHRDKDFVNAVRYAVDNGAKVINYSFSKPLLENEKEFYEALQYASDHDVLVVTSAGNDAMDLDLETSEHHPAENNRFLKKPLENFIQVGGTTPKFGKDVIYVNTNFGKREVHLFAPANYLYMGNSPNMYLDKSSGTSYASALTAGASALLLSHFPDLKPKMIKQILMKTGTSYDAVVEPMDYGEMKFSNMSVSGRILNVYSAIKYCQETLPNEN